MAVDVRKDGSMTSAKAIHYGLEVHMHGNSVVCCRPAAAHRLPHRYG
jgi:hypothetical protein